MTYDLSICQTKSMIYRMFALYRLLFIDHLEDYGKLLKEAEGALSKIVIKYILECSLLCENFRKGSCINYIPRYE